MKFVLLRIIGNDLPGRHSPGQTFRNTRFILENEAEFPDCEKMWLINRVFDPREHQRLLDLLDRHGKKRFRMAFKPEAYAEARSRGLEPAFRYITNNNVSRNYALKLGRKTEADWILPLDGSCFFTPEGFEELRSDVGKANPNVKYLVIPMQRLTTYKHFPKDPDCLELEGLTEPQMGFHRSATLYFDTSRSYGNSPKAELLNCLRIHGPWNEWPEAVSTRKTDEGATFAGFVYRLPSGNEGADFSYEYRWRSRSNGKRLVLQWADSRWPRLFKLRWRLREWKDRSRMLSTLHVALWWMREGLRWPGRALRRALLRRHARSLSRETIRKLNIPERPLILSKSEVGKNLFVIVGTARSGTRMLSSFLDSHPKVQCSGELLHAGFAFVGSRDFLRHHPDLHDRIKRLREKDVGIFLREFAFSSYNPKATNVGFKVLGDQISNFGDFPEIFRKQYPKARVIQLFRRNHVNRAISAMRARAKDFWNGTKVPEGYDAPMYIDPEKLRQQLLLFERYEQAARSFTQHHAKLNLFYEDILRDPIKEFRRVFWFLGIEWEEKHSLNCKSVKLRTRPLAESIENFDQLVKFFKPTRWGHYFDTVDAELETGNNGNVRILNEKDAV